MPALRWANILPALIVAVAPAPVSAEASSAVEVASLSGAGCRTGAPASGIQSLTFDGQPRSYRIRLPDDYDPRRPAPLAINLHGHNGSADQHEANTAFAATGARRGYVVVTPNSTPPNWNVREAPGERRGDECTRTVDEQHRSRLAGREAEVARQVEDEEGQDHRARAVHERRGEENPDAAWHPLEVPPRLHGWGDSAPKKSAARSGGASERGDLRD